jgi:diguanylate cyclase (GGDEF)-like protein
MLKARDRGIREPWLLLGLLFMSQLWSLYVTIGARFASPQKSTLVIADVLAMLIAAGLARVVWQAQAQGPRREASTPCSSTTPQSSSSCPSTAMPSTAGGPEDDSDSVTTMLQELAHKAHHDSLTGLPNRSLASDRLQRAIQRAERHGHSVAVMFIDLNGFKPLNDTYGHDFGDKVLRKTAERLRRSVREVDTVARLGGDEFLVIMEQLSADKALETAQTLATIVQQPFAAKRGPVSVGMSTGIAMYPQHGTSARQLLRTADEAMYRSKRIKGQPVLAAGEASVEPRSPANRFNETTTLNLKMLDTWEGTLRGLRALSEPED